MAGVISADSAMTGAARGVRDGANSWQQQQQQLLQLISSSAQSPRQMQQLQWKPPGACGCGRIGRRGRSREQTLFQRVLSRFCMDHVSC